ncbi:hypothetical protein D9M71_530250 [compost metagenome]
MHQCVQCLARERPADTAAKFLSCYRRCLGQPNLQLLVTSQTPYHTNPDSLTFSYARPWGHPNGGITIEVCKIQHGAPGFSYFRGGQSDTELANLVPAQWEPDCLGLLSILPQPNQHLQNNLAEISKALEFKARQRSADTQVHFARRHKLALGKDNGLVVTLMVYPPATEPIPLAQIDPIPFRHRGQRIALKTP